MASSRRAIPGGLRTQLLLGLCLLLVGAFALTALVVENVLTQRLLQARSQHTRSLIGAMTELPASRVEPFVSSEALDAAVHGDASFGDAELLDQLTASPDGDLVTVAGRRYLVLVGSAPLRIRVAVGVDDIEQEVARARRVLALFVLVVTVLFVALGYGFFGLLVVRPVRAIAVATERAADGDLASPIALRPRNEFGRVTDSFNAMLERLDRNQAELESQLHDLTAANQDLARTRDSLVRSEKLASVGQLAAGIAHEIGNPLAALSGYNELLRDGDLDPAETADLLERSGVQLDRIRAVIRNLLDFSRDDAQAEPQPTNVARCVEETLSLVAALPKARGVDFEVGDMSGPLAVAAHSQLVQVLVNLAMNAVDAVEGDGRVRFHREDRDGHVVLCVSDDGAGVEPAAVQRLFDPFYTTKDPGEGTGLGLAISARIVQSFGGDLLVEKSQEGGACFRVELSRAPEVS